MCTRPDGKLVTQTGAYGRLLTQVDLQIDATTKRVMAKEANNHVVLNGATVNDAHGNSLPLPAGAQVLDPDAGVEQIVRRYGDLTAPLAEREVGRLAKALDRHTNAAGESSLGAVIADAYLAGSSDGDHPAQIALTNPGGLRADLNSSLSVTYGQLASVLPFQNKLVSMDLTGQQILRLLEQQWEMPQSGNGRLLSVSSGFSYTWDASQPAGAAPGKGQRVVTGSMRLNGEVMDMNALYRVTVNSFMAGGSDRNNVLKKGRNVREGEVDLVAVQLYFRLKGLVPAPRLGRIQRLN